MTHVASTSWGELDPVTREELEQRYLAELRSWGGSDLPDEAVEAYLRFRHERAGASITTYEEGQIRKMLHALAGPRRVPDPVEQEDHEGLLEEFGARRLHLTNAQTYVAIMVSLTLVALVAFLAWVIWL